jgi:hypothetical protein
VKLHKILRAIDSNTLVTKLENIPVARPDESFPTGVGLLDAMDKIRNRFGKGQFNGAGKDKQINRL